MALSLDTTTFVSPNHDARPAGVRPSAIVIHSTDGSFPSDAQWLCRPRGVDSVSAHYLINRAGVVYRLVDPERRAWHAGRSSYGGITNWNDRSIGIELSHLQHQDYPREQLLALRELLRILIVRYDIQSHLIVAHRWIATPAGRKSDPSDWPDASLTPWITSLYETIPAPDPDLDGAFWASWGVRVPLPREQRGWAIPKLWAFNRGWLGECRMPETYNPDGSASVAMFEGGCIWYLQSTGLAYLGAPFVRKLP